MNTVRDIRTTMLPRLDGVTTRIFLLTASMAIVAADSPIKANAGGTKLEPKSIKNVIVYYEPGRFGGWPANNGIWHWGKEILVGFELGYYQAKETTHSYNRDKPKRNILARSLDGGETWNIEATIWEAPGKR